MTPPSPPHTPSSLQLPARTARLGAGQRQGAALLLQKALLKTRAYEEGDPRENIPYRRGFTKKERTKHGIGLSAQTTRERREADLQSCLFVCRRQNVDLQDSGLV